MKTSQPKRKPGRPARTNMDASAAIRSAALNVFAEQAIAAQIAQGLQAANARGAALGKLLDKD